MGKLVFVKVGKGHAYFNNVENIVEEKQNLLDGELEIGCGTSLARILLTKLVSKFYKVYPNIKIKPIDQALNDLLNKLLLG
ncbi:MAG: hypothetical protein PHC46_01775 [Clostridia bacterium]|nr:hypothetical protein [Clostridia bacterium]